MSDGFLIEMAWKSTLISGAALLSASQLKSRFAADRAAVLKLGLALLLMLPALTAFLPALVIETPVAAPPAASISLAVAPAPPPAIAMNAGAPAGSADLPRNGSDPFAPSLLLLLYLVGAAMFSGRLAAGLWTLRGWTLEAQAVTSGVWRHALRRTNHGVKTPRLLVSDHLASPVSWGWLRPVILIDRKTLCRPARADAVLAHEAAHIARSDWPWLVASRLAVAMFWFNPLVWQLDREGAQQAEEAADGKAIRNVELARYAQTLLDLAQQAGAARLPANAIAASEPGLARRLRAILEGRVSRPCGAFGTFVATMVGVAFAGPVAALQLIPTSPAAPQIYPALVVPAASTVSSALAAPESGIVSRAPSSAPRTATSARPTARPHRRTRLLPEVPDVSQRDSISVDAEQFRANIEAQVAQSVRSFSASATFTPQMAERATRDGMALGAKSLLDSANGMEQGADQMNGEARQLRSSREFAAARGIDEGARRLRDSVREMRKAANAIIEDEQPSGR